MARSTGGRRPAGLAAEGAQCAGGSPAGTRTLRRTLSIPQNGRKGDQRKDVFKGVWEKTIIMIIKRVYFRSLLFLPTLHNLS